MMSSIALYETPLSGSERSRKRDLVENIRSLMVYMLSDIEYSDEYFSLLFVDVDKKAKNLADGLFRTEDRRVAIYGPRGVGKSAILQGIGFVGIKEHSGMKLPIVAKISEARSVTSVAKLEDRFYTAIAKGIARVPDIQAKWSKMAKSEKLAKHSAIFASAVTGAAAFFIHPLSLASGLITQTIGSIVRPSNYRSLDELLTSSSVRPSRLTDLLIARLRDEDIEPVFIIDELDKVADPDIVHNFIEGNQSWFEGKNAVLTISYNIGESLKEIATASISRIAATEPCMGLSSTKDGRDIIYKRARLGLLHFDHDNNTLSLDRYEQSVEEKVQEIMPENDATDIIERTFPNTSRMLRLTYSTLDEAAKQGCTIREVLDALSSGQSEGQIQKVRVTKQRIKILEKLSNGPLTLTELAHSLTVDTRPLFTTLTLMVRKGLLHTTKEGATRVYYHLTEEGNRILHLST
ncbi:MAG: hypothetical protein JRN52_12460 [Nitrososphaerota archaeon]|nr:hypothetical protein [Nitrososphaerota archaeon]